MKEGRFPTLVQALAPGPGLDVAAAMKEGRFPTLVMRVALVYPPLEVPQ